jgi:hypothetical protein
VRIARFDAPADGVTFLEYFLLAEDVRAELVFPGGRQPPEGSPGEFCAPGRVTIDKDPGTNRSSDGDSPQCRG